MYKKKEQQFPLSFINETNSNYYIFLNQEFKMTYTCFAFEQFTHIIYYLCKLGNIKLIQYFLNCFKLFWDSSERIGYLEWILL